MRPFDQPELHRKPVALLDDEETKAIILQLTKSAAKPACSAGMTASQGLARCLSLIIKPRVCAQEKIAGEILLHHAGTLAPEIEATAPGVCTVQFTSPKNCRENVERVVRQLAQLQLTRRPAWPRRPISVFSPPVWRSRCCKSMTRKISSRRFRLKHCADRSRRLIAALCELFPEARFRPSPSFRLDSAAGVIGILFVQLRRWPAPLPLFCRLFGRPWPLWRARGVIAGSS